MPLPTPVLKLRLLLPLLMRVVVRTTIYYLLLSSELATLISEHKLLGAKKADLEKSMQVVN